ncbi:DNA-binding protein [Mesorhizobium sp. IMUNJ 23232]|uniref:DNA-binding protein n=1 Tax=Mesorhizobium sp. IMUNJ 23232 TaxID=3376064 RepID=UPI00378EB2A8
MKSNIKITRAQSPWGDRLSLGEAAGYLRVGLSTLQKRMAAGTGPKGEMFNGRWEFEISELIRWRQSQARKI